MAFGNLKSLLNEYFGAFARGDDVAPARRYFLEGYMTALVEMEHCAASDILQLIADSCESHLGKEAASVYQSDSPLMLHSHMRRAPVYPTSSS
ncbi:hypothetical protein FHR99_000336 [Litorivivens lipolytica]|uniref:Uncharacterized protein n=1 Tax=Litorivivens lipolytica TaxID=1524264 RepID=A0A7W4Z5Q8_9GAMM|nr:hypothetical protein [Litorivivens lipolytica]MBB3046100.1 hypothetical protein [Litorivivens lipolytica]